MPDSKQSLFGQIALKNRIITEQQLEEAMGVLTELEKRSATADLGEILQDKGFMTAAQVASVQRAATLTLIREADKVYAAHALKRGLVTKEQAHECVQAQDQAYKAGKSTIPSLGELLLQKGYITAAQHQSVLEACPTASAILKSLKAPQPSRVCGAKPRVCNVCGGENSPDATNCSNCGDSLGEQILAQPDAIQARDLRRRKCPTCKTPLAFDAFRCPRCAQRICPNCDLPLEPGVVVCGRCTTPYPGREEEEEAAEKELAAKRPLPVARPQTGVFVGIAIGVVCAIVAMIVLLSPRGRRDTENGKPKPEKPPPTPPPVADQRTFENDVKSAISLARDRLDAARGEMRKGSFVLAFDMCTMARQDLSQARRAVPPGKHMSSSLALEIEALEKQIESARSDIELAQADAAAAVEISKAEQWIAEGNVTLALDHFKKAAEIAPNGFQARFRYGEMLLKTGDHKAAARELDAARKLEPDNLDVIQQLAILQYDLKEFEKSYANFERILRSREDPASLFYQALIKLAQQDSDTTTLKLEELLTCTSPETNRFRFEASRILGDIYRINDRQQEMADCYQECLRLDPDTCYKPLMEQLVALAKGDTSRIYRDIVALNDGRKFEGLIVEETAEKLVISMQEGAIRFPINRADVASIEKGGLTEYGTLWNEFISRLKKLTETDTEGHLDLGIWCMLTGNESMKEFAVVEFISALKYSPDNSEARSQLKSIGYVEGDGGQWIPRWMADFKAAKDFISQKNFTGALQKLEAARKSNPTSLEVRLEIVRCLVELGDSDAARTQGQELMRRSSGPSAKHIRDELKLLLERAATPTHRPTEFEPPKPVVDRVKCATCDGTGHVGCEACASKGYKLEKCPKCKGTGRYGKCGWCDGTGRRASGDCNYCDGSGRPECPWRAPPTDEDYHPVCQREGMTAWMIRVDCQSCMGTAKVRCSRCKGEGYLDK